jgi:hypothetical protein
MHLPDNLYVSETLESLRASFNRSLRVEGKADRTLVLYGQSIIYFSAWRRFSSNQRTRAATPSPVWLNKKPSCASMEERSTSS